jgi:hypothetical protein
MRMDPPAAASNGQTAGHEPTTWAPIDLAPVLDGDDPNDAPAMLLRTDGLALAYQEGIHALNGEPESLKSAVAQAWTAWLVRQQRLVVYIDCETSARTVVRRLLGLGLDAAEVHEFVRYIRPTEPLAGAGAADLDAALEGASLVVLDGLTEALVMHGFEPNSNRDVAAFFALVPQRIAQHGIAVAIIDHVVKSKQERGRWAVGAGHKLALVDVAYRFDLIRPGLSRIELVKDRHGLIRESLGGGHAGEVELKADGEQLCLEIRPPLQIRTDDGFRPTVLMERVSRFLELAHEPLSARRIVEAVEGKSTYVLAALKFLVSDGNVSVQRRGQAQLHTSAFPFRCFPSRETVDDEKGQGT